MFHPLKERLRGLLRRSQNITGTDNVYIARGGFWTTLQFIAGTAASVGTVIAFGNLLPRETYGIYKYLLSLAGTFGFLTLTGMNVAVLRAVAQGQAGALEYAVNLQIKYNLLATAVIGGLAAYYGFLGNPVFAISLTVLALALPLTAAYNTYTAALIGKKRFDLLAAATALSAFVAAAAVIIALLLTDSVAILIGVYAAATLIPNILAYWYVRRLLVPASPSPETVAELRQTGFHLTFVGILGTVAQYLDKIVLFQVAGPLALAVYGFAIAGPDRLKGFAKNLVGIALPKIAERDISDIRSVFYKRIGQALLLGIAFSAVCILLIPPAFRLVLPKYLDSILFSQIYTAYLIFVPASSYIGNIFLGQNMLRATYMSGISISVLRIILFPILGWYWHTWGLVAAAIVVTAFSFILYIIIWEVESRRLATQAA